MEQDTPKLIKKVPVEKVLEPLNIKLSSVEIAIPPFIASTGLKDLLVCVKDEKTLNNITPNLQLIKELTADLGVVGVHVFCFSNNRKAAFAARNFAPLYGIDEESATGTSNGAMLCYLKSIDRLPKQSSYIIKQGVRLGNESHIFGRFLKDRVWIGGHAKIVKSANVKLN